MFIINESFRYVVMMTCFRNGVVIEFLMMLDSDFLQVCANKRLNMVF